MPRLLALASALLLACATPPPAAPARLDPGAATDALGARLAARVDEGVFDGACPEATPLAPDVVSTPLDEGRTVVSADGTLVYFHRSLEADHPRLMVAKREGGVLGTPELLPFSNAFDDLDPFVTPDGGTLYFASFRPDEGTTPRPDSDLFVVHRDTNGTWGTPVRLGDAINGPANELFPSTTRDGALWFNSDRAGGQGSWDLYRAGALTNGFTPAQNLGAPINTERWEYNPAPTPDGNALLFGSLDRAGGAGKSDVWLALRDGTSWRIVHPGACIDTPAEEYHPAWAAALGGITFIRNGGAGGDVLLWTIP